MVNTCQDLPEKFLKRLGELYSQEVSQHILETYSTPRIPSFRINTLKTSIVRVKKILAELGFELENIPWYPDAFLLRNKTQRELTETDIFIQGCVYIQNLSSMIPALILNPHAHDIVLDIAAAPGSKTTQIAALMHNEGVVVANDISRQRIFRLITNLKEQGVTNTEVISMPGQTLWKHYLNYFDKVLVDVPCSMEGRFYCSEPKTFKDWTLNKVRELPARQKYLLRSAISATKPGGSIVYSTCTLSPEENENILDWILKKEKNTIELEEIIVPDIAFSPAISYWHKEYNSEVQKTKRILPSSTMEGFYIAKIKKRNATII